MGSSSVFSIIAVLQHGRIAFEGLLLAASARRAGVVEQLVFMEPSSGPLWPSLPPVAEEIRARIVALGARIETFDCRRFGRDYPYGNKIEAIAASAPAPFLFLDTDTVILGPLDGIDTNRPSASMKRTATWPKPRPGWPGHEAVWRSLHGRFGLDFERTLLPDRPEDDWERYLYFNAGWVVGPDARAFGRSWADYAAAVREDPGPTLEGQSLDPWLDQVTLPLAVNAHGGGRPERTSLDDTLTCHWRTLPLLYARENDETLELVESIALDPANRPVLEAYAPFRTMFYEGGGAKIRAMFDRTALPEDEAVIRKAIRAAGLWVR